MQQYKKAKKVLEGALSTNPDDCYVYKELSFAEMALGNTDAAAKICETGITKCSENALKAEIAYNMAYHYLKQKDNTGFKKWGDETKKWAGKEDQFSKGIERMEATTDK